MLQVKAVFVRENFHLEITFNNNEQRIIDMKAFLANDRGLLHQIIANEQFFNAVMIDEVSKTLLWPNGVSFDTKVIYENSYIIS